MGWRGNIIYEPSGKAGEYAALAINIYNGCTHRCLYCYGTKTPWVSADKYYLEADPKENAIQKIQQDILALKKRYNSNVIPEIHISFTGDVYQPAEMELRLTRQVIELLIENDLPFTILTKGGTRATRDFDLLENYSKSSFGTTLIFTNQTDASEWEPDAAPILDRMAAIELAHEKGIKTWISLEPVIDPDQALELIRSLYPVVNYWKVGKINYHPDIEKEVNWAQFREKAKGLLDSLGCTYYLKKSLTEL